MKNKNILLRALLTGMLCITSLTIFTGCIDKKDGDGMVNGRTADGELPENGDAEPVPIKANKAGKPEIKDSSTTEEPEQPEEPEPEQPVTWASMAAAIRKGVNEID